jgi:hypothetical protein
VSAAESQAVLDQQTAYLLEACGGKVAEAARQLEVSPSTMRARVRRHQAMAATTTPAPATTDDPPPRCPGGGRVGLGGPGSSRYPVCTQHLAPVKRDGTLGSHKQLRPRGGGR